MPDGAQERRTGGSGGAHHEQRRQASGRARGAFNRRDWDRVIAISPRTPKYVDSHPRGLTVKGAGQFVDYLHVPAGSPGSRTPRSPTSATPGRRPQHRPVHGTRITTARSAMPGHRPQHETCPSAGHELRRRQPDRARRACTTTRSACWSARAHATAARLSQPQGRSGGPAPGLFPRRRPTQVAAAGPAWPPAAGRHSRGTRLRRQVRDRSRIVSPVTRGQEPASSATTGRPDGA
ncbi:hypothetical protein HBB16_18530 [Pseudonocardia sp. MCCB 268]|nr:hypothetical protein [Pseudonocardia cytotoxica]